MVTLYPGQLIYGRPEWSERLDVTEGKLRNIIDLLSQDEMITLTTVGRRYSIITVINWKKYNGIDNFNDEGGIIPQSSTNRTTIAECSNISGLDSIPNQLDNQQTTNRQPNKKNIKNINNTYTTEFELFYKSYPRPEDKKRTFNNWTTCLKTYTADQMIQAASKYKNQKAGTDIKYLKSSANFLGKEKPFEDFINNNVAEEPKSLESKIKKENSANIPEFFLKANGY